jgi:hypothetical protein
MASKYQAGKLTMLALARLARPMLVLALALLGLLWSCSSGMARQNADASQLPLPDSDEYDSIAWTSDNPPPPANGG